MIYNPKNEIEARKALDKINHLIINGKTFELKEKRYKRTIKQNRYFHLLCAAYGMEFGYSVEEVKMLIKIDMCSDIFLYKKKGNSFLRSSKDLDTAQLTNVIERFKNISAQCGLVLPEAIDHAYMRHIEEEMNKYYQHL